MISKFMVSTTTKGFMALKIDMEQAYNKKNWDTPELIFIKMGFPT